MSARWTKPKRRALPKSEAGTRLARDARPRRKGRLVLGTLLTLPLLAGAAASFGPLRRELDQDVLALHSIYVLGADRLSAEEVAALTGVTAGTSLLRISPYEIERRLCAHPWIRDAHVIRLPPGRLLVEVAFREPVARVALASAEVGAPVVLVDAEGRALAQTVGGPLPPLPLIVSPHLPLVGEVVPALGAAAAAVGAVSRSAFADTRPTFFIAADDDLNSVALALPELAPRVLLGAGGLDQKLARLELLLAGERTPARTAAEIDLRFADRAVLRGLPLPEGTAHSAQAPGGAPAPHDRAG